MLEQLRDALEPTGLGRGVTQRQHALNVDRQRVEGGIGIPVNEAREGPAGPVGQVQIGPVDGDPEVFAVPDIDEGVVYPGRLPVSPQQRVIVGLDHAAVIQFDHGVIPALGRVPATRVVGRHFLKFPEKVGGCGYLFF